MSTSLIIQTEDHITGSAQQMTVTDINPNATNANLLTFAQMTAGLSKDTYVKSARVDKVELDNPLPAPPIQYILCDGDKYIENGVLDVPLTLGKLQNKAINITIRGDCIEKMTRLPIITSDYFNCQNWGVITKYSESTSLRNRMTVNILFFEQPVVGQTYTGHFLLPASDTYAELSFDIVFTFEEG
ncbi:MAG: hypothetical protein IJG33_13515 [Selenomonadaceae bacterium]|nr:hypothetical protein [Selenomonadaceae bacterium]